jgi:hypothetical protein
VKAFLLKCRLKKTEMGMVTRRMRKTKKTKESL